MSYLLAIVFLWGAARSAAELHRAQRRRADELLGRYGRRRGDRR